MLSIHVKLLSSDQKYTVQIEDPSMTLEELTTLIISSIPSLESIYEKQDKNNGYSWLRLVWKGRILSITSEKTMSEYAIQDGDTIYASTKVDPLQASVPSSETSPLGSSSRSSTSPLKREPASGPLAGMSDMLQNPLVQSLFENPAFLQTMLEADPRFKQMSERNPEIAQMVRDPSFLRQMSEMMKNPAMMNEAMRNQDRALANLEAIPGGYNYLSSMFSSLQDPITHDTPDPSTEDANRRMAERLGATTAPTTSNGPNSQALPNPWAANSTQPSSTRTRSGMSFGFPSMDSRPSSASPDLSSMFGGLNSGARGYPFAMGNPFQGLVNSNLPDQSPNNLDPFSQMFSFPPMVPAGFGATVSTSETPFPYTSQMDQLESMGFTDKDRVRRALLASAGNVEAAIAYLLDNA